MFLLKAIQDKFMNKSDESEDNESTAFIIINVKGRDLLSVDELTQERDMEKTKNSYKELGISPTPLENVRYFYPRSGSSASSNTYKPSEELKTQFRENIAKNFAYTCEDDKKNIDLLFSNVDDPQKTMESILALIADDDSAFSQINTWGSLIEELNSTIGNSKQNKHKEISVQSWKKFNRIFKKAYERNRDMFVDNLGTDNKCVRIHEEIQKIKKNDVFVVDIAKLDDEMQGFVFGDILRAVNYLKLENEARDSASIPSRIIVFIDELNKYASKDYAKGSPIMTQLLEVTERGRSLGVVLFGAEQFRSSIHDRIKGNCATNAYGRTNAIEITTGDYKFIPSVYKNMMTRLRQGEYILQNPTFRSVLNIKFPKPIYRESK